MEIEKLYEMVDKKTDEMKEIVREQKREMDIQIAVVHKRLDRHDKILDGDNGQAGLCEKQRDAETKVGILSNRFEAYAPKVKKLSQTRDRISWLGTFITAGIAFLISAITCIFLVLKLLKALKGLGVIE